MNDQAAVDMGGDIAGGGGIVVDHDGGGDVAKPDAAAVGSYKDAAQAVVAVAKRAVGA